MKGKKTDSNFLSQFISDCISQDYTTPEDMVKMAKFEISNIDKKIKEVEQLKITRSKLLDIITIFDKPVSIKSEEAKILSFFQITSPNICKFICDQIKDKSMIVKKICSPTTNYTSDDIIFCVKQLLEHKVLARVGDSLLRGEKFEEYLRFVLREV